MKEYDHKKIEKKWQKEWETKKTYKTFSAKEAKGKKPFYVLDMFPYPSGVGLHVGHPRGYIGSDILARKARMAGFNVLHPMGYDAFGLPAEQYAIANKIHPRKAVEKNIITFKKQLSIIGLSYDWSRAVNTTDPEYYKWTQWMFLKIYESYFDTAKNKARPISELIKIFEKKGNADVMAFSSCEKVFSAKEWKSMTSFEQQKILMDYRLAYEGYSEVNWCPHLGTVLANDEIVDSKDGPVSERGGYPVEKKSMRQWFMRITAYGDRLLEDSEALDWSTHLKEIQKNWIGKSEGSEVEFAIQDSEEKIKVFTTRIDTIFGVTYVVLAPEHNLVQTLKQKIKNFNYVQKYIDSAKKQDDIVRYSAEREKTGVLLEGVLAINPVNGESVPVYVADYVLPHYGTGAVMAVPAHDERDYAFATKYNLPIKYVIADQKIDTRPEMAFRPNEPVINRKVIRAVVKHWSEDKYLILKWNSFGWETFISGGIEGDEDMVEAAKREVLEETGFKNLNFKYQIGAPFIVKFFAPNKNQNREDLQHGLYFELANGDQEIITETEDKIHSKNWVHQKDLTETLKNNLVDPIIWERLSNQKLATTEDGVLIHSGKFNGLTSEQARIKITQSVGGKIVTKYKFRDAVFARQRYWGEPIPLFKDKYGIIHEVKENKLPLELPKVSSYEPTGTGESPLANVSTWVKAGYETNTMPGWAGSSWYYLRYLDPKNKKSFADKKELNYWFNKKHHGGVNVYVGGMEHSTGHLLYSRFWHKVMFDYGLVPNKEPFQTLKNQGMILASDGRKMSKRWGNVINPDDIVENYGADTLRLYEMFIGPFEASQPWQVDGIIGPRRFLERFWKMGLKVFENKTKKTGSDALRVLHQTIKKITEDIDNFSFNTSVSQMMICLNEMEKSESVSVEDFKKFLQVSAPFVPHFAEEMWHIFGEKKSINHSGWPKFDQKKLVSETMKIMIQVNGKVRGEIVVGKDSTKEEIEKMALNNEKTKAHLVGRNPQKIIYVPGKIINFVV